MTEDRLITVAIHTYEHALRLKSLLESEGVPVVLHNVNLSHPVVSSGVRVRIHEKDLPLALRIIENTDIFATPAESNTPVHNRIMIVPVDFSDHSVKACDIAFHLAYRHKASIILLNSFLDPYTTSDMQLSDSVSYDIAETEMRQVMEKEADRLMRDFSSKIRERIKHSELPPVKFTTSVVEGVPEEAIVELAKEKKPELIVMGTRESGKKEKELIGSVTAEVLDSCRFPVFTVPESADITHMDDIRHVVFFSNLDQEDILALDAIYRFFTDERLKVTIVNVPSRKSITNRKSNSDRLLAYCTEHYPLYTFKLADLSLNNVVDDFHAIEQQQSIDLIAVPNKKKNIFARLFNPSIAHKMLFYSDIPMMVIPV